MVSRRLLLGATILCLLVGAAGLAIYAQQRVMRCAYVPFLSENILPNAALLPGEQAGMPTDWARAAGGVELRGPAIDGEGFVVDGDGRSLQLIGIANYVQTPLMPVQPDRSYCFTGFALTDSDKGSPTRLRVSFHWLDARDQTIGGDSTLWQPVVLWQPDDQPDGWSRIDAAFRAPAEATSLFVRIHPSSDDRVYLDAMQVRFGGDADRYAQDVAVAEQAALSSASQQLPSVSPWPNGHRAAISFSFDWETAMGGLIHSRSVDDPYANEDYELRGLRMREGITTTLEIFRPYNIRATYYATGYNFLMGNTARQQFMDNPTYDWANTDNRWVSDQWQTTPWFALDPYGTVQTHPAWYFGDLVPQLQQAQMDIQSHTFSHFYGGLVHAHDWRDDIVAWNRVAAEQNVPPMRSLAFPWSSSGGMSDASWSTLAEAGVASVTRLSDQAQFNLFPQDDNGLTLEPHCRPIPGHADILACPDFYLTPDSAEQAIELINRTREVRGMIDLWTHTEEVVSAEQRAAWSRVVSYAAEQDDVWIAPLREIADWQQALAGIHMDIMNDNEQQPTDSGQYGAPAQTFTVTNGNDFDLQGLTLDLGGAAAQIAVDGQTSRSTTADLTSYTLNIQAGQTVEVQVWPVS